MILLPLTTGTGMLIAGTGMVNVRMMVAVAGSQCRAHNQSDGKKRSV